MNMFDEITETKKNLPKLNAIEKEVGKYSFNGYQTLPLQVLCPPWIGAWVRSPE